MLCGCLPALTWSGAIKIRIQMTFCIIECVSTYTGLTGAHLLGYCIQYPANSGFKVTVKTVWEKQTLGRLEKQVKLVKCTMWDTMSCCSSLRQCQSFIRHHSPSLTSVTSVPDFEKTRCQLLHKILPLWAERQSSRRRVSMSQGADIMIWVSDSPSSVATGRETVPTTSLVWAGTHHYIKHSAFSNDYYCCGTSGAGKNWTGFWEWSFQKRDKKTVYSFSLCLKLRWMSTIKLLSNCYLLLTVFFLHILACSYWWLRSSVSRLASQPTGRVMVFTPLAQELWTTWRKGCSDLGLAG